MPDPQPVPNEQPIPIDTCQQLLVNALQDGGIIGIDESVEQPILNKAFHHANWLLAQWARKRWLVYRIQDYSFVSTGAQSYTVGLNQNININPRPDRLEYAFLRFLNGVPSGGLPVDIPMSIIQSHEGYSRITVKKIGTLPYRIFYDPAWPIGVLLPWPVPNSSIYEVHVGFKVVLPRFLNLQQPINFPPEYEIALNWCLARRFRVAFQMPADPEINALARDALNSIRLANTALSTLQMPQAVRRRGPGGYDYRGDSDSFL